MAAHPDSYNTFTLPDLILSHHPSSSPRPTPIITIALHRPRARNGFTPSLATSLIQAFTTLSTDPRVKAIVLTSSDPTNTTFCVGMDLNASRPELSSSSAPLYRDAGGQVALAIHCCNKPVIAAINGSAVGVGITMTLPANIRVVSSSAKVGFVFARRGFNMEACSSFFLPRLVGHSRAMHLVTTGAAYPSTHPLLTDLFSEIVPAAEVLPTALRIAEEIVANTSGLAIKVMKELMYRAPASPEEAHLLESSVFFDLRTGHDAREGIESFMQKRPPSFEGSMEKDAPTAYPWWTPVDVSAKTKL